jgi:hypothetical protein
MNVAPLNVSHDIREYHRQTEEVVPGRQQVHQGARRFELLIFKGKYTHVVVLMRISHIRGFISMPSGDIK